MSLPISPAQLQFLSDLLCASPLPGPWELCCETNAQPYFRQRQTGEHSWAHPLEETLRELSGVFVVLMRLPAALRQETLAALQEAWEAETAQEFRRRKCSEGPEGPWMHQDGTLVSEDPVNVALQAQVMRDVAVRQFLDEGYLEKIGAAQENSRDLYLLRRCNSDLIQPAEPAASPVLPPSASRSLPVRPDSTPPRLPTESAPRSMPRTRSLGRMPPPGKPPPQLPSLNRPQSTTQELSQHLEEFSCRRSSRKLWRNLPNDEGWENTATPRPRQSLGGSQEAAMKRAEKGAGNKLVDAEELASERPTAGKLADDNQSEDGELLLVDVAKQIAQHRRQKKDSAAARQMGAPTPTGRRGVPGNGRHRQAAFGGA